MNAYSLEYIYQVGIGIDVMQAAGGNQALDQADVLSSQLRPAEHPVFLGMKSLPYQKV